MNSLHLIIAACSMAACAAPGAQGGSGISKASIETSSPAPEQKSKVGAGDYLISRFAQRHFDWKSANAHIQALIKSGIDNDEILRRGMILSMGAGDSKTAIALAKEMLGRDNADNKVIAQLFLGADSVRRGDFKQAQSILQNMPDDATAKFVSPYMNAWVQAGLGHLRIDHLKENTLQLYHAILISDFLHDYSEVKKTLEKAKNVEDIHPEEMMRIADIYAHIGSKKEAMEMYDRALKSAPGNPQILEHKSQLEKGTNPPLFVKVSSAGDGLARAFSDIATALYQEYNDETARVFANLALFLQPDMLDTKLLLAQIAARHDQFDEAISYYKALPRTNDDYKSAQYKIADLLMDEGHTDEAIQTLKALVESHHDVEAQIRIGDIDRREENFGAALEAYNKAVSMLDGKIPNEYWHLHYVRGMVLEQIGQWDDAEKELKAALALQPNHPYILNYLGYAWADRGINLAKAQEMIARAVELRPSDGYIVDSLGWVKYKLGHYAEAAPILERAVSLMPYDSTVNDHLGDAYWKVGRYREARFQWERAKNHAEDKATIERLTQKLEHGLHEEHAVADVKTP